MRTFSNLEIYEGWYRGEQAYNLEPEEMGRLVDSTKAGKSWNLKLQGILRNFVRAEA